MNKFSVFAVIGRGHIVVDVKNQQMVFKGSFDDCQEFIKIKTNGKNG